MRSGSGHLVPALLEGHFERLRSRPLPHALMGEIVFDTVDLAAGGPTRSACCRTLESLVRTS
jgi:hypothetical protein